MTERQELICKYLNEIRASSGYEDIYIKDQAVQYLINNKVCTLSNLHIALSVTTCYLASDIMNDRMEHYHNSTKICDSSEANRLALLIAGHNLTVERTSEDVLKELHQKMCTSASLVNLKNAIDPVEKQYNNDKKKIASILWRCTGALKLLDNYLDFNLFLNVFDLKNDPLLRPTTIATYTSLLDEYYELRNEERNK